jgi:hypothetical protein
MRMTLVMALLVGCETKDDRPDLNIDTVDTEDTAIVETAVPVPPDGNDDIASAEDHTADALGPSFAEGVLNPALDRDYFSVSLEAGQLYHFWVNSGDAAPQANAFDSVLRLLDDAGQELAFGDDMIYFYGGYDGGLFFAPTAAGTYYLEVIEFGDFNGQGAEGDAGFTYALAGADLGPVEATDLADDQASAAAMAAVTVPDLAANQVVTGRLDTELDEDWFTFYADPAVYTDGAPIVLTLSLWYGQEPIEPVVSVFSAMGEILASTQDPIQATYGAATLSLSADHGLAVAVWPGETIGVQVKDVDGAARAEAMWALDVGVLTEQQVEPADEASDLDVDAVLLVNATDLGGDAWGNAVYGRLESEVAVDWYRLSAGDIEAHNGAYVAAWVRATILGSSADTTVTVYDAAGVELGSGDDDNDFDMPDPVVFDLEPGDGDVLIKVEAKSVAEPASARGYVLEVLTTAEPIGG